MDRRLLSKYAVVACTSPSFLPYTCAMIDSALTASATKNIDFCIILVDGDDNDLATARKFFSKRTCVTILAHKQEIGADQKLGRFTSAALTRLSLDSILNPEYSRVLYLDGDIHVLHGLEELFSLDLQGHCLGACGAISIQGPHREKPLNAALGLPEGTRYFNAGVILFDWKKTLAEGVLSKARKALQTKASFHIHDQHALNIAVKGDFYQLDYRWNVPPFLLGYVRKPYIVHFVGKQKPWHKKCPYRLQYFRKKLIRSLAGSPWSQSIERRKLPDMIKYPFSILKHFSKKRKVANVAKNVYKLGQ